MGKIRNGVSQRDPVPTINRDWVMQHSHVLTPRDVAMLRLLREYPVMTTDHLYILTPQTTMKNGQTIKPFYLNRRGKQLCRDRIRMLFNHHFVNKAAPRLPIGEGTSVQFVWLDRAGYKYLDEEGRPPKGLSAEYQHHANILNAYCMLTELARQGTINIDYMRVCYSYKPSTASIEPDLIVAFKKDGFGYKYLIEVDNCEKKEVEELRKLEKYRDWELGSQWIKEPWAAIYKQRFPRVLYLFSGSPKKVARRIKVFKERAHEVECKGDFLKLDDFMDKVITLGHNIVKDDA